MSTRPTGSWAGGLQLTSLTSLFSAREREREAVVSRSPRSKPAWDTAVAVPVWFCGEATAP